MEEKRNRNHKKSLRSDRSAERIRQKFEEMHPKEIFDSEGELYAMRIAELDTASCQYTRNPADDEMAEDYKSTFVGMMLKLNDEGIGSLNIRDRELYNSLMWDTLSSHFKGTGENVAELSERLMSGKRTCLKTGFAPNVIFTLHYVTLYALILFSVLSVFVVEWRNQFLLCMGVVTLMPCCVNFLFTAVDILNCYKGVRIKPPSKPSMLTDLMYDIIQIPKYTDDTLCATALTANKGWCAGYIMNFLTQKIANTAKVSVLLHFSFATVSLAVLYGCVGSMNVNIGSYLVELWIMHTGISLLLPKKRVGTTGFVVSLVLVAVNIAAFAYAEFEAGQVYALVSDIPFCLFMLYYVSWLPLGVCTNIRRVLRGGQGLVEFLRPDTAQPLLYGKLMSSFETVYSTICINRRSFSIFLTSVLGIVGLIMVLTDLKNGVEFGPLLQAISDLIP